MTNPGPMWISLGLGTDSLPQQQRGINSQPQAHAQFMAGWCVVCMWLVCVYAGMVRTCVYV